MFHTIQTFIFTKKTKIDFCDESPPLSTIRYSTEHHKVNQEDTKPTDTIQHQNLINLHYTIRLYEKYIIIQSHELEQKYCQVFALARRDLRPIYEMSGNSG